MHRSSDTIATIAAALAKAQVELTNPEKSLVATIRSPFPGRRTAPSAMPRCRAGWTSCARALAGMRSRRSSLQRLTRKPVCFASPPFLRIRPANGFHQNGRYARLRTSPRRSAWELPSPMHGGTPFSRWSGLPEKTISMRRISVPTPIPQRSCRGRAANQMGKLRRETDNAPGGKLPESSARSVLGVQLSASLRESLIEQLATINSADEAAAWAHRNLPAKNTLTAADAKIVEERFRARLSAIGDRPAEGYEPPHAVPDQTGVSSASDAATRQKAPMRATKKQSRSDAIRALGKTVRLRDKDHRRFVLRQACLVCGRVPSDPHHLTFTQPRALGRRVSDEFIVPVCRVHHRELHRSGNEAAWWRKLNIDPIPIALGLWQQTRTDGGQSDPKLWKNTRLDEGRTDSKPASQGAAGDGASETPA